MVNLLIKTYCVKNSRADLTLERREHMVEDVTEFDFNAFVSAVNIAISSYDLEIRSSHHQITRQRIYALVNSTSDHVTQLATIHSPDEISYLKRLLDAMFETYNTRKHEVMAVTSMQAVGLAKVPGDRRTTQNEAETQGSAGQSLTMMQAEKMLKALMEEGWFEKSRKGFYTLTPRALMELRGWLVETYNDEDVEEDEERVVKIKQCYACKELITMVGSLMNFHLKSAKSVTRVNVAQTETACVDYMIFARRDSSPHRSRGSAHCVRRIGQETTTWASAPPSG